MMTSRFGRGTIHFLIVVELNYSCRQTSGLFNSGVLHVVDRGLKSSGQTQEVGGDLLLDGVQEDNEECVTSEHLTSTDDASC